MADHLKSYFEFIGLPGSGKSFYSHAVADALRAEGYIITEPSWKLDNATNKYIRGVKKAWIAFCYSVMNKRISFAINSLIADCGYSGSEAIKLWRNILYKADFLSRKKDQIIFFDEGFAQIAVSLSMGKFLPADIIFSRLISILSISNIVNIIKIECTIDAAIKNMSARKSKDSRVEKIVDAKEKKDYLENFMNGCNSIRPSLVVPMESSIVLSKVVEFVKNTEK